MKQGFKKALVMLLSVAMVFTFMAMPVYADDFTEAEPDEVILDAAAAGEELSAEEAEQITEPEVQEEPLIEEEAPAQEETPEVAEPEAEEEPLAEEEAAPAPVQEETTEVADEPAETEEEPAAEAVELADGTYTIPGLSTAVLSMYHFDSNTARVVIKGDDAWLITSIDGTKEASTLKRFDGMAYGKQTEILDMSDETHRTLVEGTPVAKVIEIYGEDEETVVGRTFVLPVPKSVFESNADIYYMVKYQEGYSTSHNGDWYEASGGDYYLTGYTLEWESDSTALPGDEAPVEPEEVELAITNYTGMFKAVTATALENADGSAKLTFALSGTGYHWLYKGTYEEALSANDAIAAGIAAGEGSDKLIKGYLNDESQWEFQMVIDADELGKDVAVVAISDSYYQKFVSGQNALERAYYPRQFNLDMTAETLVTGDYDMNYEFVLTSNVADFKAASPVSVHIVGGPNSNNYKVEPILVMSDETYDKVTFPSTADPKEATLTDGRFAISMVNQPNNAAFRDKTPLTFTFHVAETAPYEEAGTDVERTVTFDQIAKTITVEGTALTPKDEPAPSYEAGEYIVGIKSVKHPSGADYTMFVPRYDGVNNTALVTVAEDGSATIFYDNNRNTYNAIFLGEPENLGQVPTEEQKASAAYIATKTSGSVAPFEFEYAFNTADLGKTIPYVTVSRSTGKFNSSQLAFVFDETMTPKAVYDVISMIDALPAAADITALDKDAIEAARAAYDALTAAQKKQVTNLDKLVAAEEAYAGLPEKSEETIAVETAMGTLVQQYTDVNEENAAKVAETRTAYDALSVQQKAYIDAAALNKLFRAEACVQFATVSGIQDGKVFDLGVDTSADGPFVAATIGGPDSDTYVYLYTVAEQYDDANKISGQVSKSTHKAVGDKSIVKGIWILGTTEAQGRDFTIQLTGKAGTSDNINIHIPETYGVMAEGTYDVTAIQTPSSNMRKFKRSTITSDGTAMTVEFVMPNTTYGKIFLGTAEAAAAATEGFIEPTGTEETSGSTGVGNVYSIPLESMYMPITISYCNTSKNTWTQEIIEFVVDEQAQAVIDAIAALNLNTYFNVTADQHEQVNAANELYQALNDNQKAIVENSNYSTLKRVVAMFQIADIVAAEIEKLPNAESITEADFATIQKAKADFDGMGQSDIIMEVITQGLQNSQIEKLIDKELRDKLNACAVVVPADYTAVDAAIAAVPEDLSIYTDETVAAVTAAMNAVDRTKKLNEQKDVDKMAKAINDAVAALEKLPADYSAVETAKAKVPEDLSIYTEASKKAVEDALAGVVEGKKIDEQAAVDAMAEAIEDAVAGLVEKSEQEMTVTVAAAKGIVSVGKTTTITVEGAAGEVTYKPLKDGIVTVDKKGTVTAKKVGTVQIEVTAAGDGTHKAATEKVKIYVVPGATSSVTASNLATGMKVNWKKVTGATGYKVYRNGTLIATIKSGDTVTYTDKAANTNGTKYTFKVVATASTGTSKLSKSLVTYRVSRPAISSLKNTSAKTMKATWAKNAKATGYEIMYSTSSTFASGNKTITVGSASTVSRGIGNLTKGKTYYVKMRTYKTVSGKKYYSAWSVVKTVKITK